MRIKRLQMCVYAFSCLAVCVSFGCANTCGGGGAIYRRLILFVFQSIIMVACGTAICREREGAWNRLAEKKNIEKSFADFSTLNQWIAGNSSLFSGIDGGKLLHKCGQTIKISWMANNLNRNIKKKRRKSNSCDKMSK